ELALRLETRRARDVAEVVVRLDLDRGVVAPPIRIADLIGDGVELPEGPLLRLGAHPVEILDLLLHRRFDALGHVDRLRLRGGGERAMDELLSERLAEVAVDAADAALPAGRLRFHAAQRLRIEL